MSDPIAPHSAPIAAYMSVHEGIINITKLSLVLMHVYSYQPCLCKILWPY
jgi:hypothetical protein